jgi:putative two-component system response regulator
MFFVEEHQVRKGKNQLTIATAAASPLQSASPFAERENAMQATILVVDDTPSNITVLMEILRGDYRVLAATSGEQALKVAGGDPPPELILLDVMMPGMSGHEVCKRLKAESSTRKIPVIFVTAMNQVEDEALGFDLGAVDYITKPVSPPIVKARVKTHLALYDQNRELELKVRERTVELRHTRLEIIKRLGRAGEFRDNETGMHVVRVAHYCRLLGEAVRMNEEDVDLLFNAAPMHDIGKIGIRDNVLLKPGKLDDSEIKIMRQHVPFGGEIIGEHSDGLLSMARIIALTHHEKWDGTGYHRGLKGEEIPLVGRITSIADVFDALTSARPYKKPWPVQDAVTLIQREAGTSFDPELVKKFVAILPQILAMREKYSDAPHVGY